MYGDNSPEQGETFFFFVIIPHGWFVLELYNGCSQLLINLLISLFPMGDTLKEYLKDYFSLIGAKTKQYTIIGKNKWGLSRD